MKFGYDGAKGIEHGDFTPDYVRPSFVFDNLLTLVQDSPYSEGMNLQSADRRPANVAFGGKTIPFGFFVQDDWKAKPNLSFTFLCATTTLPITLPGETAASNLALSIWEQQGLSMSRCNATVGVVPKVFANDMKNLFSPRIGFAWDPTKHGDLGCSWWSRRVPRLGGDGPECRPNPPESSRYCQLRLSLKAARESSRFSGSAPSGTYPFNFTVPIIPATGLNPAGGVTGTTPNIDSLTAT